MHKRTLKAKERWAKALLENPDVNLVAVGYKRSGGRATEIESVVVGVRRKVGASLVTPGRLVPGKLRPAWYSVRSVPTDVVEVGTIEAFAARTDRWRSSPCGVSIGHHCYDDKTRVLTRTGLKFFKDLNVGDELATLNEKGILEYHKSIRLFSYDYVGEMIHFFSRVIDLMVTPNHHVYFRNRYQRKSHFSLAPASDVIKNHCFEAIQFKRDTQWHCAEPAENFTIPAQSDRRRTFENFKRWTGSMAQFVRCNPVSYKTVWRWKNEGRMIGRLRSSVQFRTDDWLEFLGWYLSEGSRNNFGCTVIAERSGRYHKEILTLCNRMKLAAFAAKDGTIRISGHELAEYLKRFGRAKQKFVPKEIKDLPSDKLKIILASLMKGDGHFENGQYRHFKTVSWQLANDVLELGLKCNYGVSLSTEVIKSHLFGARTIKGGICYRVGFSHIKKQPRLAHSPKRVHYQGKIFCAEVPNHVMFVERNGKTCWSGNSITAGTQGAVVLREGKRVVLSNNHVLANSNDAQIGDNILQPGPHDGGKQPDDVLAILLDFVRINFVGEIPLPDQCKTGNAIAAGLTWVCKMIASKTIYRVFDEPEPNLVDAAVAVPINEGDLDSRVLDEDDSPTISIGGLASFDVGTGVKKSGRTTGFKRGTISSVGASVRVQYGEGKTALLEDQVTIEPAGFSAGGDSGSAILTEDNRLGGLLFAGSEQITIANRIEHVFRLLKLNL